MSKVKKSLTALYWLASLGIIAGCIFLMFGGADMIEKKFKIGPFAEKMPPQPPVPPPAPPPPPPPEKPAPVIYEGARTSLPIGDLTKFYQRKEFVAEDAKRSHTLTYYLYSPPGPYPVGLKFPLVLLLHDVHGKADAGQFLIAGDTPVSHPAFIVAPVLPFGKKWAMPQDFPELTGFEPLPRAREGLRDAVQLVDKLKASYPVDPARIYVVGCSEGGFGAFGAALRYPDLFAAAIPIDSGWTALDAKGFAKVPLWIFHGSQDNLYSPELSRSAASYIKAYGGRVNYTEVPNVGHDCDSSQFYRPTLWDWLFAQHK